MSGDPVVYANSGGILYSHYDAEGRQTHVTVAGVKLAVFPVVRCDHCGGDRPHHGPFCCSCGTSTEPEP